MYSILYVDDEPGLLEVGKLFLEQRGEFSVDTITSAPAAITLLNAKSYDAIISDYQMPDMDGIEFLKKVRTSGNTIPFILFTGRGREEVVIQALNEGADFYLQKGGEPMSQFAELEHQLQQAIQQRRAQATIRDHERREEDIINFLPDATVVIDRSGSIIAWNRAMEEMTGVPAADILGKGDHEYAIPFYGTRQPILIDLIFEPNEVIARKYEHIIHKKDTLIADTTLARPKGKTLTLMGMASPLYNRQSEIVGAIESVRDITERKRAEDALRESEEKYRTLVENVIDIVYQADLNGTLTFVTPSILPLLGYDSLDEIVGHPITAFWAYPEKRNELLARMKKEGYVKDYEVVILRRDGTRIPVAISSHFYRDATGCMTGVEGIIRDITERKRAETELRASFEQITAAEEELHSQYNELARREQQVRESEEKYRSLFDNMLEGFAYCRMLYDDTGQPSDFIYLNVNPAFDRIIGTRTVTGKRVTEVFPGIRSAFPQLFEIYGRVASTGQPESFDLDFRPSGKWLHISAYSPAKDHFVAVFEDITAHRLADEKIRESEERYRTLVENVIDIVYQTDLNGTITFVTPSVLPLLGYDTLDDIIGRPITTFWADPEKRNELLARMKENNYVNDYEVIVLKRDGSRIPISLSSHFHRDATGCIAGVEGIIRNISERKLSEKALRESEERYRTVFETTGTATVLIENDATVSLVNSEFERLSGYPRDEIENKMKWTAFVVKEDLDRMLAQHRLRRTDRKSAFTHYEFRFISRSGEIRDIYLTIDTIPGTSKSVASLLDVTDRKHFEKELLKKNEELNISYERIATTEKDLRANLDELTRQERVLRKSEAQLNRAEEIGRSGNWEFRLNENTVDASEGARRLYGLGKTQWTIDEVQKIPLPEYRSLLDTALKDLITGKSPYNIEFKIRRPSDQTILDIHSVAEYDPVRNVVFGVIHDITEQKRAEEELRAAHEQITASAEELRSQYEELALSERLSRKSEAYYQSILAAIPDGVAITDLQGVVSLVSPAVLRIFGFGQDKEILGKPIVMFLIPDDRERAGANIALMHQGVFTGPGEYRAFRADGSTFDIVANADFVRDAEGHHTGMVFIVHDITKRKQAEAALQERTSQIQTLIDNLPFDIWAMDRSGQYILQNPASIRHWGNSIGKNSGEIPLPPGLFEHWTVNNRKAFEGKVVSGELSVSFEGGVRTYEEIIAPVRLGDEIKGIIGANIDITERKRADEALRQSEEKFRGIFDTINDGIHIHEITSDGKPGKFIEVNEAACQMLQYTREELLKHGPLDFVTEYHSRPFDDIIAEMSTTGHSIFETGHRRKDGTIVPVEINSHVVNLQGKKVGVTMIRDISERRRADDALRLANRQLTLLTGVTRHDILNKVSMARGYLKIAEMKSGDPTQAEYLEKTDSTIAAIKSQIEFTRVYQDLGTHDPQWIGLDTVMPRAHVPKTIALNADIQDVILFSDPMLEKVFFNLLDNSIRHGKHVTEIRVSSHQSAGNLVVVWEDNGIGVAADKKERIFERGFGKNTGLGLFLAREILDITGIKIRETGEPGKGARFEMKVPHGAFGFTNP